MATKIGIKTVKRVCFELEESDARVLAKLLRDVQRNTLSGDEKRVATLLTRGILNSLDGDSDPQFVRRSK